MLDKQLRINQTSVVANVFDSVAHRGFASQFRLDSYALLMVPNKPD